MRFLLLIGILLWTEHPVRADQVRLKIGENTFGQGWMFLDFDGLCKVATAGHVVQRLDGRVASPLVVDERGRELPSGSALVLSSDPDVAVLSVPIANDPSACGGGRFSTIGIERRLKDMTQGVIGTTGVTEVLEIPVERRASSLDQGRGEMFSVHPTMASDQVAEGWSGSVVRDADGPLGIVVSVDADRNEAYAVRIDVFRRLMATGRPRAQVGDARVPALMVVAGTTVDSSAGPDKLLLDGGGGWRVAPTHDVIALTASYAKPTAITQITLVLGARSVHRVSGFGVETSALPSGNEWVSARFCPRSGNNQELRCPFLGRTIYTAKITIKTIGTDAVTLQELRIE